MDVAEAITGRHSVRAFFDRPVAKETIERILTIAARSPSGTNVQPWHVYVLQGARKAELTAALLALGRAGDAEPREYEYYPTKFREPFLARRRACGFGLYNTLGIARGDTAAMAAQHEKNYAFFGAPVGLMIAVDADLQMGSWLDMGMFIQSVMLAARGEGLGTCPQAAFAYRPATVKRVVGIPATQTFVCGIALGYEDTADVVNSFRTEREPLGRFVTWVE